MITRITWLLPATLWACGGGGGTTAQGFDDRQIVVDFADQVVVASYALLADRIAALGTAVDALAADPSQENLEAARQAWVDAREPWEQSEGFLFGPVDSWGYDPALDSWPVNRTDLDQVLASGDPLTTEYVGNLQPTQKGFHTIEYLLFGEDSVKPATEITAREIEYMQAVLGEMTQVAGDLELSWTTGVMGQAPYRDVIATAGEAGNTAYPSLHAAAQQILDGMIGICDEVANGKIADPYDAHDPDLVESQFSFNSLLDFTDNLVGVRNVWTGGAEAAGTSGRGLADWVAEREPDLAARVDVEIQAGIDALALIPSPFRDSISDPEAYDEIEAAQTAIQTLQATLEGDVVARVLE